MLLSRDKNNIGEEVIFSFIASIYFTSSNKKVHGVGCHPVELPGRLRFRLFGNITQLQFILAGEDGVRVVLGADGFGVADVGDNHNRRQYVPGAEAPAGENLFIALGVDLGGRGVVLKNFPVHTDGSIGHGFSRFRRDG